MKYRIILLFLFTSVIFTTQLCADESSNTELKATKVRNNIYMLEGVNGFAGGNLAVSVGEDGILIVDDLLASMSEKITHALSEIHSGSLKYILNTHWHGDHTGGNNHFSKHASIIAHSNVRKRLMQDQQGFFGDTPSQPKNAWPVITFDESLTIHFNDEAILFTHYPNGHTDGDGIVIFKESNVAHLGDLFFTNVFPFVDINSGGNVFSYTKNVEKIIRLLPDDVKIIPGHGVLTDLNGLKKFHSMLVETCSYVKNKADKGISFDDIKQEGLPEKWMSWGKGFIKEESWITFIYQSI